MKRYIAKAIFASFGIGTFLSILLVIIVKEINKTPVDPEQHYQRMNCFAGLEFILPIGIQIILAIAASLAFLTVFERIRNNKFLLFSCFFSGQIIIIILSFKELFRERELWVFVLFALFNLLPWGYFYLKFRRKFTTVI